VLAARADVEGRPVALQKLGQPPLHAEREQVLEVDRPPCASLVRKVIGDALATMIFC
jgi:hypothetical protein